MRDALVGLLDKVDIAVAESADVLAASDLEEVTRIASNVRVRLSYPETTMVVALAGGTGSGKSSILNAIAGDEVALTGGIRPMTTSPLALVPVAVGGDLNGYLDFLGISERVVYDGYPWLCLIDLPDNDSVDVEHRHRVASLLPLVDMVIWVTDPEKYRDGTLHLGSIAPLVDYQKQFVFVLNQIDRIDQVDFLGVAGDFAEGLREDGVVEPRIIATAAQPVAGPPIGIDELVRYLKEGRTASGMVHSKLLTDLAGAASRLVARTSGASGVEFERRWETELEKAVALVGAGDVADAAHELAGFVSGLADLFPGATSDGIAEIAEDVPSRVLGSVAAGVAPNSPKDRSGGSWRSMARRLKPTATASETSSGQSLSSALDREIGDPIRDLLAARGRAHAAITDLSLAVSDLKDKAT